MKEHLCYIPCNTLPLVGEADFGLCLKPIAHCDRIADFNVLIYLLKSSMEIIEDGITYTLTPGTLFFLKSGIHHWGTKPFEYHTAWYYIHFYTAPLTSSMTPFQNTSNYADKKYLSSEDFNCAMVLPKCLQLPLGNELEKQIEQLISLYQSPYSVNLLRSNLALCEILLHSFELGQGKMEQGLENTRIRLVINFLEQNFNKSFTPESLSNALGLSYKYIGTLFKKHTGMTIKEYQLMLRLKYAVKLLCETQLSIAEIATEAGFYDAFYFSKVFKREKGISPLKFRTTYVPKI